MWSKPPNTKSTAHPAEWGVLPRDDTQPSHKSTSKSLIIPLSLSLSSCFASVPETSTILNNSVSLFVLSLKLSGDFSPLSLWSGDVPRIARTLTTFTSCWLLPSGLRSSVAFLALPSFTFLGHGTFQNCCCLDPSRQSFFLWEEHDDERERNMTTKGRRSAWFLSWKKTCLPMVAVIRPYFRRCHRHQQRTTVQDSLSSSILLSLCSLPTFSVFCVRPLPLMPTCKTFMCVFPWKREIVSVIALSTTSWYFSNFETCFIKIPFNLVGAENHTMCSVVPRMEFQFWNPIPCQSLFPHAGKLCFLTPTCGQRKCQHIPNLCVT